MFLSGKTRLCVVSTHAGGVVVGGVVCVERRKEGRGAIFKMSIFAPLSNLVSFWLSSWRCPGVHRWILVPDVRCHTRHFVWRQQICHHCACRSGLPLCPCISSVSFWFLRLLHHPLHHCVRHPLHHCVLVTRVQHNFLSFIRGSFPFFCHRRV